MSDDPTYNWWYGETKGWGDKDGNLRRVRLQEIKEPDYPAFINAVYSSYAQERSIADHTSLEDATNYSNKVRRDDLQTGFSSPGHLFYYIYSGKEKVGTLWLTICCDNPPKYLYVSDIVIYEPYRRRGYASAALLEAERIGREAECERIDLNVFARNKGAQILYRKLGYSFSTHQMNKEL